MDMRPGGETALVGLCAPCLGGSIEVLEPAAAQTAGCRTQTSLTTCRLVDTIRHDTPPIPQRNSLPICTASRCRPPI